MGKGGGGKGGGGGSAPQANIPYQQLGQVESGALNLSGQEQGYINDIAKFADYGRTYAEGGSGFANSPILQAENAITNQQTQLPGMYQGEISLADQLAGQGQSDMASAQAATQAGYGQLNQAQQQLQGIETGTGLYPSQQAYVNQAVQSGQAAVQQQLASEGLSSSTQNAMLQNQIAQSGAATAGQLIQGNIQLGQSQEGIAQNQIQLGQAGQQIAQQLTVGEQALGNAATQNLQNLWGSVASQWAGLNEQGFSQALQGLGMVGQFFQGSLQGYGYDLDALKTTIEAQLGNAKLTEDQFQAEQQAQSQGMSSMFGGLGQLFGGGGGSGGKGGGGLLGGIGGLFGGASSLAGGLGAGAAGTAVSGTIADVAGLAALA